VRIGISADWHLGLRAGTRTDEHGVNLRTLDFERAATQVVDGWIVQKVEVAIAAGDLYHSSAPDERSRQFLARELNRLARSRGRGLRALVVSLGNHDAKATFDDPTAIGTAALALGGAEIVDRGTARTIEVEDVALTVVPWMKSDEELYRTLAGLSPVPDRQNLLFLHVGLSELAEFASLTPGTQTLTRSQVPRDHFDWVFSGHFHKYKVIPELRFTFIGSPERTSAAEIGTPKGYLTYDTQTRAATFHPIKTRSWYSLGTIDASDWDATRLLTELELVRKGVPDWNEALIWGKIIHIAPATWAALDVRAYKALKASAFACEIETTVEDPALPEQGSESVGEDAPILRELPEEWAEYTANLRTRKGDERERIAHLGLAALQGRDLLSILAEIRAQEATKAAQTQVASELEAAQALASGPQNAPRDHSQDAPAPLPELIPAAPGPHELRAPRKPRQKKTGPAAKKTPSQDGAGAKKSAQ
jgi:DNA repair exonuclease SbcCD nuclease subunit